MIVSERFGPTVQGEGPSAGRRAIFLRLGTCNLDCGWCDTPYTWDFTGKLGVVYERDVELKHVALDELWGWVWRRIGRFEHTRLVITGGEPLMQQDGLVKFVRHCPPETVIEIETNGTRAPHPELVARCEFNVSPKLDHAGVSPSRHPYRPDVLRKFVEASAIFKFVAAERDDIKRVEEICAECGIPPHRVWIMPEGRTSDQIVTKLADLAEWTITAGFNLSTRLHVHVWGDRRGH